MLDRNSRVRYEITRLFNHPSPRRVVMRRWWWRFVRRHEGEICNKCGRPVNRATPTWWWADDALWMEVVDDPHAVWCAPCFTDQAWALGVYIFWQPAVDSRKKHGLI